MVFPPGVLPGFDGGRSPPPISRSCPQPFQQEEVDRRVVIVTVRAKALVKETRVNPRFYWSYIDIGNLDLHIIVRTNILLGDRCNVCTSLVLTGSMPKLCISRRTCSFGSWLWCATWAGLLIGSEATEGAVYGSVDIHLCFLICSIVYRFIGSKTSIFRIRDSHSMTKIFVVLVTPSILTV